MSGPHETAGNALDRRHDRTRQGRCTLGPLRWPLSRQPIVLLSRTSDFRKGGAQMVTEPDQQSDLKYEFFGPSSLRLESTS